MDLEKSDERREAAVKRVKEKRDFKGHAAVYVIVNVAIIAIWALSGAGYFWPIWAIVGWGVGLAFHGWGAYFERSISEEQIQREMERGR